MKIEHNRTSDILLTDSPNRSSIVRSPTAGRDQINQMLDDGFIYGATATRA